MRFSIRSQTSLNNLLDSEDTCSGRRISSGLQYCSADDNVKGRSLQSAPRFLYQCQHLCGFSELKKGENVSRKGEDGSGGGWTASYVQMWLKFQVITHLTNIFKGHQNNRCAASKNGINCRAHWCCSQTDGCWYSPSQQGGSGSKSPGCSVCGSPVLPRSKSIRGMGQFKISFSVNGCFSLYVSPAMNWWLKPCRSPRRQLHPLTLLR